MRGRPRIERLIEQKTGKPFRVLMEEAAGKKSIRQIAADIDCDVDTLRRACTREQVRLMVTPAPAGIDD